MLEYQKINEYVYRILNAGCDVYLINHQIPVLIDCGCCKENIKDYCEGLIHKEIHDVFITHSHIDHTGHCGLFENVYMTKGCSLSSKNPMDENPEYLDLDYNPIFIEDHQILKFEDLELEVFLCDCHSKENVMYLDKTDHILFTGDEMDQDQVLLLPPFCESKDEFEACPSCPVKEYQTMLERINLRKDEFDQLCTGHNGSPLSKESISVMIDLCQDILDGKKGKKDCRSKSYDESYTHFPYENAHYARYEKNGFALVYCEDDLYHRQSNNQVKPATLLHKMCRDNLEK